MPKRGTGSGIVVGVDVGGTKVLSLAVDPKAKPVGRSKCKTRTELGVEAVIDRIAGSVGEAVQSAKLTLKDIDAVGLGFPGLLQIEKGIVRAAPNMPGWQEISLAAHLERRLGCPVFLDNDVNMGTLGEYTLGAGQGARHAIGIFIGTGIGGGLIFNGQLYHGRNGTAGEIGHLPLAPDGPQCGCGQRACLEAFSSRSAVARDIAGAVADGASTSLTREFEGDLRQLTSSPLKRALRAKDKLVIGIMRDACRYLGRCVGGLVNLLSPDVVILGGGVMEAIGDFVLPEVERHARAYAFPAALEGVRFVPAALADDACALGAACLARQKITGAAD